MEGVSRETLERLDAFAAMLVEENSRQNLIAASTVADDVLWTRHILDSAQLAKLGTEFSIPADARWADLGSGPGLPGLVVAILAPQWAITLIENRPRRCDFLRHVVGTLGLAANVMQASVERLTIAPFDVISARAFAPLPRLWQQAEHISHESTLWLLPKGKNAAKELCDMPQAWQKQAVLVESLTDVDARIIMAHRRIGSVQAVKP